MSTPDKGELLGGRYRLDTCLNSEGFTSGNGHSVWRGTDQMLKRPVTIEVQTPGGPSAVPLIDSAVTAGSIGHPCVAGVYDAVNADSQAFVVREWVEGRSIAELLDDGPLAPARASAIIRDVADGIAAIHSTENVHGGLSPDTVIIGPDGEVTLTGLNLAPSASYERDMRAIGGLLYAALTGHWPAEFGTHLTLPDAVRLDGMLCSPRQVRAGVPAYLDALAVDLLDPSVAVPQASELAAEMRRYDITDPELSPLTSFEPEPPPHRPRWKKLILPAAAVACIVTAGLLFGTRALPYFDDNGYPISDDPTKQNPGSEFEPLDPAKASILDPDGDGTELSGAENVIDGDKETSWEPDSYTSADFGGIKAGMGIVIDLGTEKDIRAVTAHFSSSGANVELRASSTGSKNLDAFRELARQSNADKETTFTLDSTVTTRYVLLWITRLPETDSGRHSYSLGVNEVTTSI